MILLNPDGSVGGFASTDADGRYIFDNLAPGAYTALVIPNTLPAGYAQTGDPDGSLDGATIALLAPGDVYVNADFGYQAQGGAAVADIGDKIFLDADASGTFSAATDQGIAGVTVSLLNSSGAVVATAITDAAGDYLFGDVPTGADYTVSVTDTRGVLNGLNNTADPDGGGDRTSSITNFTATDLAQDFGFAPAGHAAGDGLIGDAVFFDLDNDGAQDLGEGVEGVTVRLFDATGSQFIGVTTTDENGNYYFGGLDSSAAYTVEVETTGALAGATNSIDPDPATDGDSTSLVDLSAAAGGIDLLQDFGYSGANSVSGLVWLDPDADGARDGTEGGRFDGVSVDLYSADGNRLGTAFTDSTGAYSFANLPDGDYTVDVTDTGNVLEGYWHSLGADSSVDPVTVALTGASTEVRDFGYYIQPAAIGDFVFDDLNGNGVQDSGEPGIGGAEVTLTVTYSTGDVIALSETTFADGSYRFEGLLDEDFNTSGGIGQPTFVLTAATPLGYAPTSANTGGDDSIDSDDGFAGESAELVQGASDNTNDFGFVRNGTIGNYVWLDENGDGVQDAGEDGIAGVTVELRNEADAVIDTTITDANGGYLFTDVATGVARTVSVVPATLGLGLIHQTGDPDASIDNANTVTLTPGQEYLAADFGYNFVSSGDSTAPGISSSGAIGDRIWNDADGDGIQDAGEAGIAGVTVELFTDPDGDGVYDNLASTQDTDVNGTYIFDDLPPGAYVIVVTPPAGYTQTGDMDGTLDSASTSPILIAPGDVFVNADFGYQLDSGAASIGTIIYFDADADGAFNAGTDFGIPGVTVALLDSAENVIATTTTNAAGNYIFPGLPSGETYQLRVTDTDSLLNRFVQTGDPDVAPDGASTVTNLPTTGNLVQNFGYTPISHDSFGGIIGDTVFIDTNNDGAESAGEGIEGITVELYDATGITLITSTTTDENGNYYFVRLDPFDAYTVRVVTTGALAGLTNSVDPDTGGDDTSQVDLAAVGGRSLDQDFGYIGDNEISGLVWLDPDADGSRVVAEATRFAGVSVDLLDAAGNVVSTTTTGEDGSFTFLNLPDGTYTVDVTDDANVLAGYWHSIGTDSAVDPAPVTVSAAASTELVDFGYYRELSSVGNFVFKDVNENAIQDSADLPIAGALVTMVVTYPNGAAITLNTLSAADGSYSFGNLLADENYNASGTGGPSYLITVATPDGLEPATANGGVNDAIDSDDSQNGESAELVQGAADNSNDFGFTGKAQSFPEWQDKFADVLGTEDFPFDNPDGDLYDNVIEFALCDHPGSGVNEKPFCVELGATSGTVDAIFTRARPAPFDLTYTLEIAPAIGSPPLWASSTVTPVIVDNNDGTETVTFPDLEAAEHPGTDPVSTFDDIFLTSGIARLRVTFGGEEHYTPVFGWSTVNAEAECETVSNPYAPKEVSSAAPSPMAATAVLDLSNSAGDSDISATRWHRRPYYIEIVSGTCEGHRFDVLSATADSITLDTTSARNTLAPIPDLSDEQIVLRPHLCPRRRGQRRRLHRQRRASQQQRPSATAGRLLFFDNVNGWSTYFAYNARRHHHASLLDERRQQRTRERR